MKVHVHWMKLMKDQIIQKFQRFEILNKKLTRQRTHFKNHLIKKCSMGFKVFNIRCRSHVKEISTPKNMFGCSLKFILGFLEFFTFLALN
jgi:hypothetical protein